MSKSRLLSGRVKKITGSELDLDRSQFLNLANAEPDLGNPDFDGSILVADIDGNRYWSPSIRADVTGNIFLGSINSADGSSAIRLTNSTIIEGDLTLEGVGDIPNLITSEIRSIDSSSIVIVNSIIAESDLEVQNDLTVNGNFTVLGSTTTINSTTLTVEDKNIELARNSTNAITSDGAGITVLGPDVPASIVYNAQTDTWNFNKTIVGTVEGATGIQDIDDRIDSFFDNDINTTDSSSIVFVPSVEMRSDLTVDNDLRVENTVYATKFIGDGSQLTGVVTGGYEGPQGPTGYTGSAGPAGNDGTSGASDFTALTDTPESYVDQAGKIVAVNQTATGLEFITGAAAPQFAKTYFYEGTVTVETGDIRLYLHRNATLKKIKVSVVVAGTTDSILQILKNGTGVQSITIPANQSSIDFDNLNIVLLENDYITIDITQGSSAEDLYVILIYEV